MQSCKILYHREPISYENGLELQRKKHQSVLTGESDDTLILLQHLPTITIGHKSDPNDLLSSVEQLDALGIHTVQTDRGGEITYHAPGQLVAYPILDLNRHRRDIHLYIRNLEKVIIDVIADFGIAGTLQPGLTGVWVGNNKIAAIGVKVSKWVTLHGFSLNVSTDLAPYGRDFVQCGLHDKGVTSMGRELPEVDITMDDVYESASAHFCERFSCSASFDPAWV